MTPEERQLRDRRNHLYRLLGFTYGSIVLLVIGVVILFRPEPGRFGEYVLRTILALAGGGFIAVLPGKISITSKVLQASGAIAVFVIIFRGYSNCPENLSTSGALSLGVGHVASLSAVTEDIEHNFNVTIDFRNCDQIATAAIVEPATISGADMKALLEDVLYRAKGGNTIYKLKVVQKGVRYEISCGR